MKKQFKLICIMASLMFAMFTGYQIQASHAVENQPGLVLDLSDEVNSVTALKHSVNLDLIAESLVITDNTNSPNLMHVNPDGLIACLGSDHLIISQLLATKSYRIDNPRNYSFPLPVPTLSNFTGWQRT
jgi:hypothetical protein